MARSTGRPTRWARLGNAETKPRLRLPNCARATPAAAGWTTPRRSNWNSSRPPDRPVSPEAETDEELKLMAINGLMQSDPERAFPLLEDLLKGSASPEGEAQRAVRAGQSNSPKAQALVEQIARGGGNPDLQVKAISYMDERRRPTNNGQVLSEIYAATNDTAVKRAILQAYANMRDKDRLLQAAKNEKIAGTARVRHRRTRRQHPGTPELWQLYQTETTPEGKIADLLRYMYNNGNADKLLEVVRNEKDPKVRADAMRVLASQRSGVTSDALVSLYNAETGSADQAEHPGRPVLAAQRQGAGGDRPRGEGHQDEAADRGTPLEHEVGKEAARLPRGAAEEMKTLHCWLMAAALPLAAQPKLLVNAQTRYASRPRPGWSRRSGPWSPRSRSRHGSDTACRATASTWDATMCATAGTSPA